MRWWRRRAEWCGRLRARRADRLLSRMLGAWKVFCAVQREDAAKQSASSRLCRRLRARRACTILNSWKAVSAARRRAQACATALGFSVQRRTQRLAWSQWRCKWGNILYWRAKQVALEVQREAGLRLLGERQNEELERERIALENERTQLASKVEELRGEVGEKVSIRSPLCLPVI